MIRPAVLAREIAASHYPECRANRALFEHRVRNDERLVGLPPIIVDLVIRIAIALFVWWITNRMTEVSVVANAEEMQHLRSEGLVSDD